MFIPPNLAPEFMRLLTPVLESQYPDHIKLRAISDILIGCQGAIISQLLTNRIGDKVFAGPFRGMQLTKELMKWHFAPTLLGTYEWELHDVIEAEIANNARNVVIIGCSHGYYAVGFALRMPQATVYAYDTDPEMREHCRKMAEQNGVADRVIIGERPSNEELKRFAIDESIIFMDSEDDEVELLDPQKYPALLKMNVIAKLHDDNIGHTSTLIPARFAETHKIKIIPNAAFNFPLEKILGPDYVPDHFDNLIATWEARRGPTPFGYFMRK